MVNHARRLVRLVVLLLALGGLLPASPARAADVPRIAGAVTDQTGALAGSVPQVENALRRLLDERRVQLFVVFVRTSADLTVTQFADETARVNSLGGDDALLVVALDDRTDAIWVSDALAQITDREIDAVLADALEPGLRQGDYAGAVVAAAQALGEAAVSTGAATSAPSASPSPSDGVARGIDLGAVVGVLALIVGGVILLQWVRSRRSQALVAEERDRRTGQLARQANAALIQADERVRAAEDEAGFVEAEYGESEAQPFREAVVAARTELREAFAVRQRLDDATPEDPPTREAMLNEILQRLGRAGAAMDRQAGRIRELRDLERTAPAILPTLPARVETQEARLVAADAALAALRGYAEPAWASVRGNVEEARKGLAGARAVIQRAEASLAGGDRQAAARDVRLAQEAISGSTALLDAVERLAATVRELERGLPDALDATDRTLAEARAAITVATGAGGVEPDRQADLAAAEDALRVARASAAARPLDPIAAQHLVSAAAERAAGLLAAARQDAQQQATLAAAADAAVMAARQAVVRATDFVATRHGGVGREARTRLAEAQRSLEAAEAARGTDQRLAQEHASRAHRLAAEAYQLASSDFDRWDRGGPAPGGGGGSDIAGAILGGIIGSILANGGRGGGWGGSPWGSGQPGPGGWGSGGWGGGRSRGGSFGGSGGFGGGGGGGTGGRSRGGRW